MISTQKGNFICWRCLKCFFVEPSQRLQTQIARRRTTQLALLVLCSCVYSSVSCWLLLPRFYLQFQFVLLVSFIWNTSFKYRNGRHMRLTSIIFSQFWTMIPLYDRTLKTETLSQLWFIILLLEPISEIKPTASSLKHLRVFLTTRLPVALSLWPDWLLLWLETLLPLSFHRMRWLGGDVTDGGGCWDGKCGGGRRRSGSAELQQHRQVAKKGNRLLLPTWEKRSTRWGVTASLPRSRHTSRPGCCFCTTVSLMSLR